MYVLAIYFDPIQSNYICLKSRQINKNNFSQTSHKPIKSPAVSPWFIQTNEKYCPDIPKCRYSAWSKSQCSTQCRQNISHYHGASAVCLQKTDQNGSTILFWRAMKIPLDVSWRSSWNLNVSNDKFWYEPSKGSKENLSQILTFHQPSSRSFFVRWFACQTTWLFWG